MRNTRRRSGQSGEQENGHDIATPEPNDLPSTESPQLPAAATPNDASKKPTKKRKLDESPPWKSATTQTPTSFIGDDGRRKSGRTNALRKDLMPPPSNGTPSNGTPTRSTRISHRDVSTSASRTRTPASSKQSKPKRQQSPSSRAGSSRRGVKATPPSASSSGSTRSPPSKKFAPNSRSRNQTKTPTRTSSKSTVSPVIGTRKSARALQKAVAAAEEELAQGEALRKLYGNESSELSSYVTDEEEDEETGEDASISGRVPKLRLKFGMPRAVITHPTQVPLPKPFASFEEFLAQDSIERNPELLAQAEEEAREEAELRNRIDYEARHGLLTAENCSLFVPEKQPEPPHQYSHHDHLVAHALNFHKLLVKERKEHQELMRKRNVALMAEIKRRRPRTREEIELEQYTENRKAFKEQISQLRRKWEEVMKEVEKRRITRAEEDRRRAGKEHLNRMLEHSTVLLDARRGDRQGSLLESGAEDESGSAESDNEEGSDEEKLDEANVSDSESDPDVDGEDEDANLTVEELRAKYSGITVPTPAKTDEDMDLEAGSDEGSDVDMVDERHNDVMALANGEDVPELDEVDDVLLDDSDRSTDMDSDADSEGEYDDEEDDEDDEEESGLLGFYGGMSAMTDGVTAKSQELEEDFDDEEEDDDDDIDLVGVPKPAPRIVEVEKHEPSPRDTPEKIERPATPEKAEQVDVEEMQEVVSTTPVRSPNRIDISICKSTEKPCVDVVAEAPREPEERQETEEPYQSMNIESAEEARPRIVELEDDGETPKPSGDAPPVAGKAESVDIETGTSTSLVDAKDSGPHSSPTTSPEATPQPADADAEPKTPIPFLLRGTLRKYQHHGLDWLAGLYDNHTNGILADEMGLGKTIQTIALIAHLACEKGIWGPHLIVVPTSVMLNWEMEFKKWAPGFKILTYYGSREQRAEKRKGWLGTNNWHVCITSYQIVLADQVTFKRRNWHYLILDEAHNIKNFRSQRWQTLLNFKSQARLLLTGTPLQNNLVELWSLLYFLMPSGSSSLPTGFANLQEFQEWFAHPVDQMIEGGREGMDDEAKRTVTKLHKVLRPYLLRRLKADVEKQMPAKYEHVVYCRLSKRQRYLYDDFMSMAKTRETLASGNYLSIINCLMQLRKVCNHPDLFETRQIVTSFAMQKSAITSYDTKELLIRRKLMAQDPFTLETGDTSFLEFLGLVPGQNNHLTTQHTDRIQVLSATELLRQYHAERAAAIEPVEPDYTTIEGNIRYMQYKSEISAVDNLKNCVRLNRIRTQYRPLYSSDLVEACSRDISVGPIKPMPRDRKQITSWFLSHSTRINSMIPTLTQRAESMETTIIKFGCITPAIVATDMAQIALTPRGVSLVHSLQSRYPTDPFHEPRIRLSIAFPDKRLLQYDCGKLQRLDTLLRTLQAGGHRALIFTQMTKVLDLLEQFLNIHGHRYLRLDGATKVEMRQQLTDRFNNDARIPVFILSTRSGGLGINLTGADTVIFYDLDWNPAMDKQCQDRCHRIGQTRDVHIYRFVSEYTIESNILRKSEQKRMLDDIIIQEGDFTTDYFNKLSIRDMLGDDLVAGLEVEQDAPILQGKNIEKTLEAVEDIEDTTAAKVAQREVLDTDVADFAEEKAKEEAKKEEAAKVAATPTSAPTSAPATTAATPAETPAPVEEVQVEEEVEEVEPGHVDDYMIRFVEWELKDVPVVIPDKSRRKRSKKGKKF